jgi:thioredoxin-related protein
MKKILIVAFLFVCSMGFSQDLVWHTDIKEAIKVSEKQKKPLLLFFTGSDWCGWCIRLQNEVLKTPEFADWAKQNVVLVDLDFPRRTTQDAEIKKQNSELQQVFKISGFPTIFITNFQKNKDGKINFNALGRTGYVAGGPMAWLAEANNILKNK